PSSLRNADFIAYFEKIASEKKSVSYRFALKKLKLFAKNGRIPFAELNDNIIKDFIKFLVADELGENTIVLYMDNLNYVINSAIRERIITENPIKHIPKETKPKPKQVQKVFLTIEELRTLKNT